MIRILVISLVVANLLLLAFQSSRPSVRPQTTVTPAPARATGVPTIHLFSEMMKDQGLMSGNRQCFTLGPFHSSEDRDTVRNRLLDVSTRISERETEALVEKGYWVFMPPYANLLEANQELLALQALGLKDVGIMYDGEWQNAISLGYFMRQENAQRRQQDLESRGHKPVIRIQRQAEPRYWLDYEQNPGSGLIALDMQNRPNDFMQRPVPCPEADFLEANNADLHDGEQELADRQATGGDNPSATVESGIPAESEADEEVSGEPAETAPEQPAVGDLDQEMNSEKPESTTEASEEPDKAATGQSGAGSVEERVESAAAKDSENAAKQPAETSAGQEPANSVEPVTDKDEELSKVNDEALPNQGVGTGPDHSLPAMQPQDVQSADGEGADDTSGQAPRNTPESEKENPPPKDSEDTSGVPAAPAAPEKTGSGDANGTTQNENSI